MSGRPLFTPKRVRGTILPPSRCGNGHELTPDNLLPAERGTRCRGNFPEAASWALASCHSGR